MRKVPVHVRELFQAHPSPRLVYHNLGHTEQVVKAAEQIVSHYQLEEQDHVAVYTAVWFHDTGYLFGCRKEHEEKSVEIATAFLEQEKADPDFIGKVRECILATKIPQHPESLIARIVCDADLFHFGTADFRKNNRRIREEVELCHGKIPADEWRRGALEMLEKHRFQTDYCQNLLQKGKEENINRLRARVEEDQQKASGGKPDNDGSPGLTTKKGEAKKKPVRGGEAIFRTATTNHIRLSRMADAKAQILLTINSIIVSILVSLLFRRLETDRTLLIPGLLFLFTSLITVVFAVLVTMPNVTSGTFTKEDIKNKTTNLLFFGNFHKMDLADYQWGVWEMLKDADFLYSSMTRDIYSLGVVLARKYRLLRIAYAVFMVGFIVSALSFVFAVT